MRRVLNVRTPSANSRRRLIVSAHAFPLEDWLEEAVLAGAITLAEAWSLQDEILQTYEPEVVLPQELWPVKLKLDLFEMDVSQMTPH